MKLLALRDQLDSTEQDGGRRHAYDLFALWACTTRAKWEQARQVADETANAAMRAELNETARQFFGAMGVGKGRVRVIEALRREGYSRTADADPMAHDLLELFGLGA